MTPVRFALALGSYAVRSFVVLASDRLLLAHVLLQFSKRICNLFIATLFHVVCSMVLDDARLWTA